MVPPRNSESLEYTDEIFEDDKYAVAAEILFALADSDELTPDALIRVKEEYPEFFVRCKADGISMVDVIQDIMSRLILDEFEADRPAIVECMQEVNRLATEIATTEVAIEEAMRRIGAAEVEEFVAGKPVEKEDPTAELRGKLVELRAEAQRVEAEVEPIAKRLWRQIVLHKRRLEQNFDPPEIKEFPTKTVFALVIMLLIAGAIIENRFSIIDRLVPKGEGGDNKPPAPLFETSGGSGVDFDTNDNHRMVNGIAVRPNKYTAAPGDSFYSMARLYGGGITAEDIAAVNTNSPLDANGGPMVGYDYNIPLASR